MYKTLCGVSTSLIEAYLKKRTRAGKEDPARAGERRGVASLPRGEGVLIWMHAASVGESLSLLSLIDRLLKEHSFIRILVTTGTVTSAKLMAERLPKGAFHQYVPVDHPLWVSRFLDHWNPGLVVWSESEYWPNILMQVKERGIPAVLLNARMSEKSFQRWQIVPGAICAILNVFSLCFAQNEAEALRLRKLGAKKVIVSANLKYAAASLPHDAAQLGVLKSAVASRPIILWASTHLGEEEIALKLHASIKDEFKSVLSIIVPRHPKRGDDISALCAQTGLKHSRRSAGAVPDASDDIYVADTLGELGLFYRLSKLVIMGGSFVKVGGHNPIEPAQLGCVIFYGPEMYNFTGIAADFEDQNAAIRVKDVADLTANIKSYLSGPEKYADISQAARNWTQEKSHIVDELSEALTPYILAAIEPSAGEKAA